MAERKQSGPDKLALQYFEGVTKDAKALIEVEKTSGIEAAARMFDFGNTEEKICLGCKDTINPPKKPFKCAACKAVVYCGVECQRRDWNRKDGHPAHKQFCKDNKRHMEKLPQTQGVLLSFPWGRLETNGVFNVEIARGRFGVLGSKGFGFWSSRGGPSPHQDNESVIANISSLSLQPDHMKRAMLSSFNHLDGYDLCRPTHLSDREGWKLPDHLIPFRDFTDHPLKKPVVVTEFPGGVIDWDSWYRWRKLPKESPAALLMHFPLSVYQLLVKALRITRPDLPKLLGQRITLDIHMIGVEVELNMVPLFSELALLLPDHDLKLTLFGTGAKQILEEAKRKPSCLAANALKSPPEPIFSYRAPSDCGGGTVSVHLSVVPTWTFRDNDPKPNALVACNAGITSYPALWQPVVKASFDKRIMFAYTEYTEQSVEMQRDWILSGFPFRVPKDEIQKRYPTELNPFHRPGQRFVNMWKVPNLQNGFILVVN